MCTIQVYSNTILILNLHVHDVHAFYNYQQDIISIFGTQVGPRSKLFSTRYVSYIENL